MTFEAFDVVAVQFPFTDSAQFKRRPAVVLSSQHQFNSPSGHSVMAMITSARNRRCPLDVTINDLKYCGLPAASVVRMKLFTLDHRLVIRRIGALSREDQEALKSALKSLFQSAVLFE